jgi:hypothetical protein
VIPKLVIAIIPQIEATNSEKIKKFSRALSKKDNLSKSPSGKLTKPPFQDNLPINSKN